ncbi:UbiA family prenyltransferase [Xylophilus sp. Kf1]|nr:UbiA family prenyltransferase [Xylophilus sp. Kf1]
MSRNPARRVIAVDLDGTLVRSDMLVESLFLYLRAYPLHCFRVLGWLLRGKAFFKRRLADKVSPDAQLLPYNQPLIEWLAVQRAAGASLVLATASDLRIGRRIAQHVGIFDDVMGTEGHNLSSGRKRDALIERFGEGGFEYVGNSKADLAIWQVASRSHIVEPEIGVMSRFKALGRPAGEVFDDRGSYVRVLRRALRLHQWAKNLLIFVPLFAAHRLTGEGVAQCVLAFLCFGACASSVYLLNDMLDLPEDRQHRSKSRRPLAAGTFPVFHALVLMPALLLGAFGLALVALPLFFAGVLLGYYLLTLAYSFGLKRIVMVDVVALAMLYTVRVIAGAAAVRLPTTFWILAFCVFLFLSLAFVKRYTELYDAHQQGSTRKALGRGYVATDFPLLGSLGTAAGYLSVLVLALYINDSTAQSLYPHPQVMWMACPLLLYWLSRVWLLAHRGQMNDDPIVFALRDRASRWVGLCFILTFVLAAL